MVLDNNFQFKSQNIATLVLWHDEQAEFNMFYIYNDLNLPDACATDYFNYSELCVRPH